ncbi:hypothetical protein PC113_g24291 [Phytophthora cactorum]|uniref:MULE transposase domain-containing protein n=1 Tax=Phytophthora cactorum TaxID=29920 RepID=A0A8T0Y4R4_9STRA|nr:hypothetical protein PC113_g24291 [Phytophthora cactorum]
MQSISEHTCEEVLPANVVDVRFEMRERLQCEALRMPSVLPTQVWDCVYAELRQDYGEALNATPERQEANTVKNTRGATGQGMLRVIDTTEARFLSDEDQRTIVQFNVGLLSKSGKLRRMIGFGHLDLILLLRQPSISLFVDETYALNMVMIASDRLLAPASVTCAFDLALINAALNHFPKVHIAGCLFHWEQDLRRRMLDFGITKDRISDAMTPSKLDILTVIPESEISDKAPI